MKKITILFAMVMIAFTAMASPVEPEQAQTVARNFMMRQSSTVTRSAECTLVYTKSNDRSDALFYVYNVGGGFVIVAADDAVKPVLGYSTTGSFDPQNIPSNCASWLQGYADEIAYVKEHNLSAPDKIQQRWTELVEGREPTRSGNTRTVEPLLTTTWDQSPYYNALCPGEGDDQALTGCVATAMAQIINYYEYPAHGFGSRTYDQGTYGELFVDYDHATYRYDLMPDELDWNTPAEQVNAVATLMYHCGVAANMAYSSYESSAYSLAARAAFVTQYGYDAQIIKKENDSIWIVMLKEELDQARPIYYCGDGRFWGSNGGHAFVCDGYGADDFFHFNFGWSGSYDGYFQIGAITTDDYHAGSNIIGDEGTGFTVNSNNAAIFARPAENTNTILFNYGGHTTRTISEAVQISDAYGFNDYFAGNYSNSYYPDLTIYPENEGDQVRLDVLAYDNYFTYSVYDGEAVDDTLLIAERPVAGTTLVSNSGALTIHLDGRWIRKELVLQAAPVSCIPVVRNVTCSNYDYQSATLSWEVVQPELFSSHTYNWQVEYGPQGFEPGTGIFLHPDSTGADITGLNADTYYDAYITYTCANGSSITLDPFTFKTAPLAECYEPIGTGRDVDYTCISTGYYSWSQQIFTADELAAAGLTAGDPLSVLWLQYYGEEPLNRLFGVYIGHTDKTVFANEQDFFDPATLTNVYPETSTTFVNTNTDYWFPLYFSNTFVWDGTSNIVIAFVNNSGTLVNNQNFYTHPRSGGCTLFAHSYYSSDGPVTVETGGSLTSHRLNIKFCSATNCMAPTELTATAVSRTEVQVEWNRMYQENEWTVEYGLSGFEHGHGTTVTVTGNPTTLIGDLENGLYDFYVRANCGGSNYSDWRMVSAYVLGDNDCVEFVGNDLSSGSLVATMDRDYKYSQSQQIFSADALREMGVMPGEPMYALSVQYNSYESATRKMSVYMANTEKTAFANYSDWFNTGVLTNVFPETDFTFEAKESGEDYRWVTFNFDVPFVWDGSSNVVVAFTDNTGTAGSYDYYSDTRFYQHTGNANNTLSWQGSTLPTSSSYGYTSNYLSNIRFCEGCMYPVNITYTTPSRHEIDFVWQPANQETEWRVEYGPAGFEQGTGTMVTVSGTPELAISQLGHGQWDFYFQSDCGNGSSLWKKVAVNMWDESETECFQIGNGTITNTMLPFGYSSSDNYYIYVQELYTATELTAEGLIAGSIIHSLSFQYSGSSKSKSPITLWLAHTSRTNMTSSDGFIPTSEMQQVFSGEVSFSNGWINITLDQPFTWDGSSNVVVAALNNSGNTDDRNTIFYGQTLSGHVLYRNTWTAIDPDNSSCSTTSFRNNILFCTESGCVLRRTVDAIVNEGDSYDFYGRTVSEQGTYTHRFYVDEECDSLITLNLTVRKIIYVVPGGSGTHSGASWQNAMELQEAMDTAATYTDVTPYIYVKKGTYTGNTSGTNSYEIRANVRAYGGFNGTEGPYFDLNDRNSSNVSTLNGSNARRVLYQSEDFTDRNATLFDGFTIRGGTVNNVGEGGAAYIRQNCTLRNCKITANNASITDATAVTRSGVAVYNNGGTLENCEIYNNSITLSGTGSGHTVRGVGVYSTNGTIENCTLRNNTTVYDGTGSNWNTYGGGVYLENSNTLSNCSITLNSASDGGGVCVSGLTNVNNCIISNNTARGNGGGVNVLNNSNYGFANFTQCLIGNNVSGGTGGGIYDGKKAVFNGCDIVRNSAATDAGGVYTNFGTTFVNSIIWGNKVGNNANHIAAASGKYFTFLNSAFPGYYSGALTLQEENSGTGMGYPNFTNPTAEAGADANNAIGDWTLQEGSFLIGLGNNGSVSMETDLNGNARIQQERVDIGAYESAFDMAFPIHPETPSNIIYVTTTGAGLQDGSSWSNATANLQYAMDIATGCTPPASVWVAQGTYTQEHPYIVHPNVAVYGSFVGNEPYNYDLSQRDFENNATILDGENTRRVLDKTCPFNATTTNANTTYYTEPVEITMPVTGTKDITACSGTIYDDGGANGNFSPNCNGEIIIRSYNPNGTITLTGTYNNSYYGRLKVYDGIGGVELANVNYDGNLTVTSTKGAMVVQFTSGSGSLNTGFALQFSCSSCEPEIPESAVDFRNGESLFDGFTVQNGSSSNNYSGAYLLAYTDLINCIFQNNANTAVYADNCAIDHCSFVSNNAYGLEGKKSTISNSRVANNNSIGIYGSNFTISNCIVENNSLSGIYFTGASTLTNSIIRNNNSDGVYCYIGASKISDCIISGNRSYGLYISSNSGTGSQVFNTSILNNGSGLYANGGLYVNVNVANNNGMGVNASNGAQFTNCHIVRNYYNTTSTTVGAGVSNGSSANQFTNCVIWGNMAKTRHQNISGSAATYAYCAVEGGADGTANITLDSLNYGDEPGLFYPNFVNPSDTAGLVGDPFVYDWNLDEGSACINQGIANATSLNLPETDLGGSLRIKQGRIDIGAYEYGGLIVNRVSDTICLGEDFWYGEEYVYPEETGLYLDTFTYYENNIDYVAYISLLTNENYNILIDTAICEGESVFFDGEARTETGEYTAYEYTSTGCDSTVTLNLTVLPHSSSSFSATACDSYTWNNETYYESGDYQQIFEAANGCDSTVTLHLTINESSEYEFDQIGCVVHNWNGISYRQSGDYTQTFRNLHGCDSTVTMHLTILDVLETEFNAIACDSYTWNDETYTTSGDKVQYFESALHCDSIVTLHLTIHQSIERSIYRTACDNYTWNEETYTESGTYQQVFIAANGCDSTVTLHLTINHSSEYEFSDEGCDQYVWNNQTYAESGDYQQVLTNAAGCDSTVTLHLTILHSNTYEFTDVACDQYIWNNQTYYESGDYQQVLTNAAGCDSTVTLHLTINNSNSYEFSDTGCDQYVWNDEVFTVSGDYQQVLTNAAGCDSTVTLHLTINNSNSYEFSDTGCDQYVWNDEVYTESGDYQQEFTNAVGCDSSVTLHLTIYPTYQTQLEETICQGELPYHYVNGLIDTTFLEGTLEQTTVTYHFSTSHGCDSTVTLQFNVIPITTPQITVDGFITACESSTATLSVEGNYTTFNWSTGATTPTIEVTTPGYYWVELVDENGCSSITEVTQLGVSTLIPETPAICMVGVENGHNLVIWEELENSNVQNYRVYREDEQANIYELLATVPVSQGNAYEDVTADPTVRAWRYKVTAMDVCQGETPMSELHKTVHLTINQGIGDTWNLIWTHYEGIEFTSYRLYRGTTNNNLELIATLPSTLTSYTDFDNVDGALFYQIEVVMDGTCLRHIRDDVSYTGARSNIVYNGEMVYTDTTVVECDSYEWFGTTYTESGDYQHVYTSDLGYDCTATLHLTINPSYSTEETATAEGNYEWHGTTYTESGDYTWTGQTIAGCDSIVTLHLTITTGVSEWNSHLLRIYPNPTNNILNVHCTMDYAQWQGAEIQLYDMYGKRLQVINIVSKTTTIDLTSYATGVYLLKMVNNNTVIAVRKVVRR